MAERQQGKVVRSYGLVFHRRWRIFRIQGWRIPLPGGIELRLLGYWLASLAAIGGLGRLPVFGTLFSTAPPSLRLLALPLAAAWALSRWEVDGRPPHRALAGLIGWYLRPRQLAALRRVPPTGTELAPLGELAMAPDLSAANYPAGRLRGPLKVLLRYPVSVEPVRRRLDWFSNGRHHSESARVWRMRALPAPPLHNGKTLEVPAASTVVIEAP